MTSDLPKRILRILAGVAGFISALALIAFAYGAWHFHARNLDNVASLCMQYIPLALFSLAASCYIWRCIPRSEKERPAPYIHIGARF